MKRFTMRCEQWNTQHVKFSLFDPSGANCGWIVIRTDDIADFIARDNWNGGIDWNDNLPALYTEEVTAIRTKTDPIPDLWLK